MSGVAPNVKLPLVSGVDAAVPNTKGDADEANENAGVDPKVGIGEVLRAGVKVLLLSPNEGSERKKQQKESMRKKMHQHTRVLHHHQQTSLTNRHP